MISSISMNRIAPSSDTAPTSGPARAEAPSLLPSSPTTSLACSGDLGSMLAAMLLEASDDSRKAARLSRAAAEKAEDAAFAQRIGHMREAADQRLIGGITSGATSAASGLMGGFGGKGVKGAGEGLAGSGKAASSFFESNAADADIAATRDERAVQAASRHVQSADDRDKEAKELAQRTLGHLEGLLAAKNEAAKAALFRA